MKNDSTFVVRLPKEDLEKLNEILKKKAINRSELFRIWVRKYIEENEKNQ
ncbi:ribbon-helix-helix protein, CopG family [Neobacillus sedimentimangrovi]|nr:ribbon-helix-helix protein, CopG family [Neobacillus sedimentimangrovi]